MNGKRLAWAAALLVAGAGLAQGATLADLELQDPWMGEEWSIDALKDHVVVVEFWGYN